MTARPTQPVEAPTGLRYGERKQLEDSQRAMPLPDNTPSTATGTSGEPAPVSRPNVFAPSDRPGEPLTAGAAEGAGPSQLGLLPADPVAHIRALYQIAPNDDLRRLLERASER